MVDVPGESIWDCIQGQRPQVLSYEGQGKAKSLEVQEESHQTLLTPGNDPSSGPWSQVPNSRSHISEKRLGQFSKSQKDPESAQIREPGSPYHQLPSRLTRKPY